MNNIFHEVTTLMRRERLQDLWDKYNLHIIGGLIFLVILVASFGAYAAYRSAQIEAAMIRYENMLTQIEAADDGEALTALEAFAAAENNGYAILADFRRAVKLLENEQNAEAGAIYDALSRNRKLPPALRSVARLYGASALLGVAEVDGIEARLSDILISNNSLRPTAREIYGLALILDDAPLEARAVFQEQLSDPRATPLSRQRAYIMLDEIGQKLGTR